MKTVLFLGSTNSIRTQMAEALLRHYAPNCFHVHSAGMRPSEIHPMTLQVLEEVGVDAARLHPKGVRGFLGRATVDWAIILRAPQEDGPRCYPFALQTLHWPIPCLTFATGPEERQLDAFRETRDGLDRRIRDWLAGGALAAHGAGSFRADRRVPALESA